MEFCEIARFLNIPETAVRSLGKQGLLPGQPHADGWETTLDEIEDWYVKFSGKEWADLVANGRVSPLMAKVDLEDEITQEALLAALESWEQRGIVRIISHKLESSDNYEVVLTLYAAAEAGRRDIESVQHAILTERMRNQIELASRCESIIGEHPALVTLSRQKNPKLSIEDDMAGLPQREREIIRFYLASYVLRLSAELQRKYPNRARNEREVNS